MIFPNFNIRSAGQRALVHTLQDWDSAIYTFTIKVTTPQVNNQIHLARVGTAERELVRMALHCQEFHEKLEIGVLCAWM